MTYWLNIDKPTKKCTIHEKGCIYEISKVETPLKGIGALKSDGGWLFFDTMSEVKKYFDREWAKHGYELSTKCRCLTV